MLTAKFPEDNCSILDSSEVYLLNLWTKRMAKEIETCAMTGNSYSVGFCFVIRTLYEFYSSK